MADESVTEEVPASRLTKVTVNLVPRAIGALEWIAGYTGYTKTDVINRALQLYAVVEQARELGKTLAVITKDGSIERITLT